MSEIRLLTVDDFDAFTDIVVNAYPGWKISSKEDWERVQQRLLTSHREDRTVSYYGLFRAGELIGGMRFHDFQMNLLGARVAVGGVGLVAVHLLHKKEHVAKEMIAYFLRHYRGKGAPLTLLYPFRPDFYKSMGFGYGTKMNQYRVPPSALPKGPSKVHVRYLGDQDKRALLDCYQRVVERTHGMMEKSGRELDRLFKNESFRIVGYVDEDEDGDGAGDGRVRGYVVFAFEPGESFIVNDLHVREFIYENQDALSELMTFLHTQFDQIRHVILDTQDEYFHHVLLDPRNGSPRLIPSVYHESNLQGLGVMYRVVNTPALLQALADRDFGGQTCRLKLTMEDSFLPENTGGWVLHFEEGRLTWSDGEAYDVEVRMEVAEFSALLMGTATLDCLYRYGLVRVSDPKYVGVVDRIFRVPEKPICTTAF